MGVVDSPIGERLGRVARENADAVALVDGSRKLTYGELIESADRLAAGLRKRGIGPRQLVGVALPRSAELVLAVVGIVRAGAGCVPVDLAHPPGRRSQIMADASPRAVLTDGSSIEDSPPGLELLSLAAISSAPAEAPPALAPTDPAFVLYTSGSTGPPNGVCVTQRNAARLFTATEALFGFGPEDVWTLFHSIAFDFSVWELWGALLHGGRLVIVPGATARSAEAFHSLVLREGVTVLNQTPSAFRAFDAADAAAGRPANELRHVIFGGEALDPRTLARWIDAHGDEKPRLANMYGTTEATVHVTYRRMFAADARGSGRSLIGSPLPDLRVELLGADGRPVAAGEVGEIHVGGAGVSSGYLGRAELTAKRFLPDAVANGSGTRLHRSGDLARRHPDGELEYLGRAGAQVKLRGFSLELGEIEAALRGAPGVRDAVVSLRADAMIGPRLVAHFVPDGTSRLDPRTLRDYLVQCLPEHMVPGAYVAIQDIPRTVNDKVDRTALPEPHEGDLPRGPAGEAPREGTEQRVAAIWSELLGVEVVRREDDFVSLGGHSLLAARVASACNERLGAAIPALAVLEARTLASLAERVDAAPRVGPLERIPAPEGPFPLTPGQRAVLLQQQFAPTRPILNEPVVLELHGTIDTENLVASLRTTLASHPALRTRFSNMEADPRQECAPDAVIPVELVETDDDAAVGAMLLESGCKSFDLARGPLARASVVKRSRRHHLVVLVAHHLVIDEWSVGLLLDELGARLRGEHPVPAQDPGPFAHAVRCAERTAEKVNEDREFWRAELEGASFALSFDVPAAVEGASTGGDPDAGGSAVVELDERDTALVRGALKRADATEFEGGLAALAAVLEHQAHRPDVVVLTTLADRDRADVTGVVGYLLDVLPVRIQLHDDSTASELLIRTREARARASGHRSLALGEAVAAGGLSLATDDPDKSTILFTRREDVATRLNLPGVRVVARNLHLGVAKFDLYVALVSGRERMSVRVEHRLRRVDSRSAERLAERVARVLVSIATHRSRPLAKIEMLGPEERREALAASRGPVGPPPPWPLVPDRVAELAGLQPDAPAIVEAGRTISYGELIRAADELARELRASGVGAGDVVPVIGPRSAALVTAWLAVLRSGAAYAPIDLEQPPARRTAMLEDCRPRVVIADETLCEGVPKGIPVLALPVWGGRANTSRRASSAVPSSSKDLAYVVFTSGSTGRPKGVEIGHEALAHIVAWHRRRFDLTPRDRMPLLSGLGFDATVLDTWSILCTGGSLHVPPEEVRVEPPSLRDWIVEHELTVAFSPTILGEVLIDMEWPASTKLRSLQAGGEALRRRPPASLPFELVNLYGPSEAAVWVTHAIVESRGSQMPPIGVPLDDVACYVVDHRGRLCADRGMGELWLAGPQLAHGYRGLAERTAQSFPLVEVETGRRERVYRTGDLARRGAGGVIDFIGRRDQQVKIRGYRIELGEISACLGSHAAVQRAVVVVRDAERGTPRLVAYVVPREETRATDLIAALTTHASERLPRYMLPAAIVLLPSLPVTPNGKLDRAALPDPLVADETVQAALPTPLERRVLGIWRQEFGNEKLGLDDEFFAAGGHSLLAVRIVARLESERGVRLPMRVLFDSATPRRIAHALNGSAAPATSTPAGVLSFRAAGKGAPLFCLPGVGGHAFQYRELAERMRANRPIFALQIHDLDAPPNTLDSIEQTADAFARCIREVKPHGPYALTGYSYGGIVALEIARRLIEQGESVPFVGLLDTYAPGTVFTVPRLEKFGRHLWNVARMSSTHAWAYVSERVRRRARRLAFRMRELRGTTTDAALDLEQRIEETSIRCTRAMSRYSAQRFPGRITVFRAARLIDWMEVHDPSHTCGWNTLCSGVEVQDIDCEHLDLFNEPHITELAKRLDGALDHLGDGA